MTIRLVLVDDHCLFREGLCAVLSMQKDIDIVAEAADAKEACAAVLAHDPDVVLLDVTLPGLDGISVARELFRRGARAKVLFLSMHASVAYVAEALAAGATGYALKDQPAADVVEAIRAVAKGQRYLAPKIPRRYVEPQEAGKGAALGKDAGPLEVLTPRERAVFHLVVNGFSNEGVAGELSISVKTVETHRAHINRKLAVHSTGELIRFAAMRGLLPQQTPAVSTAQAGGAVDEGGTRLQ
jgi:two-component system, NarL family, response regulator NreC